MSNLNGNINICCVLFFNNIFFLVFKALFGVIGETIEKMEQEEQSKPPIRSTQSEDVEESKIGSSANLEETSKSKPKFRSTQSNFVEQSTSCLSFSSISQSDRVNLEPKTSFIAQNNLSSAAHCSSVLLNESQFVHIEESAETDFVNISSNEGMFFICIIFKLTKVLNYYLKGANNQAQNSTLPKWIVELHNKDQDQLKNVFFNSSQFDIKSFLANYSFLDWYENKLETSDWKEFNFQINLLVDVCVKQLETYFSTKQKPKTTRMMHSTERHHLSSAVTYHFPKLVLKYSEYRLQCKQGILDFSKMKTSPCRLHFMVSFLKYKCNFTYDYF